MQLSAFAPRWFHWPAVRTVRPARAVAAAHRAVDAAAPQAAAGGETPPLPVREPAQEDAPGLRAVLQLLHDQLGLDAVHVQHTQAGGRRLRTVVALRHGPAAALASGQPVPGELLRMPVRLQAGALRGHLCCLAPADPAERTRTLRMLQHAALLAARLLEHQRVLHELARQSGHGDAA